MTYLHKRLIADISRVGLPTDFELELRGYSKVYDGRYDPNTCRILLYHTNRDGDMREYDILLRIAIHEAVHHYQWNHDPDFVRVKGVMHDPAFHDIFSECLVRAKRLNLIGGLPVAVKVNPIMGFAY